MKAENMLNTGNVRKGGKLKTAASEKDLVLAKITTQKRDAKNSGPKSAAAGNRKKGSPENLLQGAASQNVYALIQTVRNGIGFEKFKKLYNEAPFSLAEWANYLHLSERTMQRYQKEEGAFAPPQSEKILEIMLLIKKGESVFGEKKNFYAWLQATNMALGSVKPKELLDSSFGINLLNEELIRIEHGIFA